ncbi:MAG: Hsp33 family molecular chaperone HslO [Acetilactobacillus jinshanensis]
MKDYLLKAITKDGLFRAYAINATNTVAEAQHRHQTTNASSAALGRTIVASLMLSSSVLEAGQSMTVRIDGQGPAGLILVDANANGDVKGFIQNPQVELPTNAANEVDVGKAVGKDGFMQVIKNLSSNRQPYTSNVHLESGHISDDFTYYLNQSEQIPSSLDVSVLVNANDTIGSAGGYLIQKMPGATDKQIAKVKKQIKKAPKVTGLLSEGDQPEKIINFVFGRKNLDYLQKMPVQFKCRCSKKSFGRDIAGLKPNQIKSMIDQDHGASVVCSFCGNRYKYSEDDLKALLVLSEARVKKSNR